MESVSIQGKEQELFRFMKDNGFPVFHMSNIFLRDIQYGIRDYFRATRRIDVGSRKADALAAELVADLERRNILQPTLANTWLLHMEEFLNPPKVEEKKAEAAA